MWLPLSTHQEPLTSKAPPPMLPQPSSDTRDVVVQGQLAEGGFQSSGRKGRRGSREPAGGGGAQAPALFRLCTPMRQMTTIWKMSRSGRKAHPLSLSSPSSLARLRLGDEGR